MIMTGIMGATKLMGAAQGLGGTPSSSGATMGDVGIKSTFGSTGQLKFAKKGGNDMLLYGGAGILLLGVLYMGMRR